LNGKKIRNAHLEGLDLEGLFRRISQEDEENEKRNTCPDCEDSSDSKRTEVNFTPSREEANVSLSRVEANVSPSRVEANVSPSKVEANVLPSRVEANVLPSRVEANVYRSRPGHPTDPFGRNLAPFGRIELEAAGNPVRDAGEKMAQETPQNWQAPQ
jgi:hypothetical protein